MQVGDELNVYAEIVRTGRTSITVATRGHGRERSSDNLLQVAAGTFTFVTLGPDDQPVPLGAAFQVV
jgi:acyl-CoA thioesterase YciA